MKKLAILLVFLLITGIANSQDKKYSRGAIKEPVQDPVLNIQMLISKATTAGTSDSALSLHFLDQAMSKARELNNTYWIGKVAYATGDIYFHERMYNRALANYKRAAAQFQAAGKATELTYAFLGLAKCQFYRGNYQGAAANFMYAVKTGKQYHLPQITGEANEYLGLIYNTFQNFKRNTGSYIKSLEIKQSLHDDQGVVRVAGNLSEIFYQSGNFDSAIIYSTIACKAATKLNLWTDVYMAEISKTAALIRLGKIKLAEEELKFFDQLIPQQDANLSIRYQTLLGNYYLATGDEAASQLHYDSALHIINNHTFPELLIIVYNNIADSYLAKGDLEKAYNYFKKYNNQLSTFYSRDNLSKLANLEGLLTLDDSKDEIQQLNNENKLKALLLAHEQFMRKNLAIENLLKDSLLRNEQLLNEALARENQFKQVKLSDEQKLSNSVLRENQLQVEKLKNEKRLRTYLLSGLGLFVVLGAIIFAMYKRQRRKSLIIQKQSEELKTLMKEIHHRVKNNLQIISSLLDLQSLSIKDRQASGAVKEGKLRVQSMALIHQNLYHEGNIKGILVKDYILNLVENLFNSYNIQKDKVRLVTEIDHLNLDVDTVIPLGLIINELINNSLKYAFHDQEEGKIFVSLKEHDRRLELHINDNGCGFPPSWNASVNQSFGFKLIRAFAQKLKAQIDVYNDNGACVTMNILKYKIA